MGQVVAHTILNRKKLRSEDGEAEVTEVVLADIVSPSSWLFPELGANPMVHVKVSARARAAHHPARVQSTHTVQCGCLWHVEHVLESAE